MGIARNRAAASSIASGRPSSRVQIVVQAWRPCRGADRRGLDVGSAARPRSMNSATASSSESGGTGHNTSPGIARPSRLVAQMRRDGHDSRRSCAIACRRCDEVLAVVEHERARAARSGTR